MLPEAGTVAGLRADALPNATSLAKLKRFFRTNQPLPAEPPAAAAVDARRQSLPLAGQTQPRDCARPIVQKLWDLCSRCCTCNGADDDEADPPACPLRRGRGLVEVQQAESAANVCPRGEGTHEPCPVCLAFGRIAPDLRSVGDASPEAKNARLRRLLGACPAVTSIYEMALKDLERGAGERDWSYSVILE